MHLLTWASNRIIYVTDDNKKYEISFKKPNTMESLKKSYEGNQSTSLVEFDVNGKTFYTGKYDNGRKVTFENIYLELPDGTYVIFILSSSQFSDLNSIVNAFKAEIINKVLFIK